MTSRFSVTINMRSGDRTRALYDAIRIDNEYYTGPDTASMSCNDQAITVTVSAARLAHLRAGINSILRLAKAADAAMTSTDTRT